MCKYLKENYLLSDKFPFLYVLSRMLVYFSLIFQTGVTFKRLAYKNECEMADQIKACFRVICVK